MFLIVEKSWELRVKKKIQDLNQILLTSSFLQTTKFIRQKLGYIKDV